MQTLKFVIIKLLYLLIGIGFIALGFYFWKTRYFGLILAGIGIIILILGKNYHKQM